MREYEVKPGDCLASIASAFKTTWERLWDANPELRELRDDPGILAPGDIVKVPDPVTDRVRVEAGKRHVFRRLGTVSEVRFRLFGDKQRPRAETKIRLVIGGAEQTHVTDAGGTVTLRVPANAKDGLMFIGDDDDEGFPVRFGDLDPIDTPRGLQMRLRHLGYYFGEVDGLIGPLTRQAIRGFQLDNGAKATGEADEAMRQQLKERFGS